MDEWTDKLRILCLCLAVWPSVGIKNDLHLIVTVCRGLAALNKNHFY